MNWEAAIAMTAMITLGGSAVAFLLRPIHRRLDSHAQQFQQIEARGFQTAETMARTVTLLDQVEKRVTRIENHDDAQS